MCECEEFEDYELIMETNSNKLRSVSAPEAVAVENLAATEKEIVPALVAMNRKK